MFITITFRTTNNGHKYNATLRNDHRLTDGCFDKFPLGVFVVKTYVEISLPTNFEINDSRIVFQILFQNK